MTKQNDPPSRTKDWTKVKHTCPNCEKEGFVEPDFGLRTVDGNIHSQSWCKTCRGVKP